MFSAHMFSSESKNKFLPSRRIACSYVKAWANPIVRKNFNFLENIIKHGSPLYMSGDRGRVLKNNLRKST